MSRRRKPHKHWQLGDRCLFPVEIRMAYPPPVTRTRWSPAEVVAIRGDQVVVRHYRWEKVFPAYALRRPVPHGGPWWKRYRAARSVR